MPKARKLAEIGYEEMLELSNYGFKMHPRSIELGSIYKMPILVRSSCSPASGTLIHQTEPNKSTGVCGIATDKDVASITLRSLPNKPGTASKIFGTLAKSSISVDTIVKNASFENQSDLTFTVSRADLEKSLDEYNMIACEFNIEPPNPISKSFHENLNAFSKIFELVSIRENKSPQKLMTAKIVHTYTIVHTYIIAP